MIPCGPKCAWYADEQYYDKMFQIFCVELDDCCRFN